MAYPVILGMLGHTFVGFIDNVMVGRLGTAELAAVSLGNSFVFIAMALGIGFSTAITPLLAEADSSEDFESGKSAFKHGLVMCFVLGIILFVGISVSKPLLYVMKQPPEVITLAMPYIDLVAFSLIPLVFFQGFKQFSDGLSMTKAPMYATISSNIINVILNYVLIFGKFGFPEMGIVGAAYGTLIARMFMVIHLWWLLSSKGKSRPYFSEFTVFVFEQRMIKKLISLGTPSALQIFFEVAIFTAAIWLSGLLGKNPQAANQIALNLSSMTFMFAVGLSVTAVIRVGNQKGLKNYGELRRIAFSIFLIAFIFAICFACIFAIFNKQLPKLYVDFDDAVNYKDNMEVVGIAAKLMIAAAIFQISDSLQVVIIGALRGLQDVMIPTFITFVAYWIIGFPVSFYLGKEEAYGSFGIWLGLLAGLSSAAIMLWWRFNYLTKRLAAST